jgi:hypothetical protein
MLDLAVAGQAPYAYAGSRSAMDTAFDRMATWLRRPAGYTISVSTSTDVVPPPEPGTVRVVTPVGADGAPLAAPVDPSTAVEIVLDTSGSMLERIGGRRRIDVAKEVLDELLHDQLPAGTPVALRVLGGRGDVCGTRLAVPLTELDADAVMRLVNRVRVDRQADTSIGAAIARIPDDLERATGRKVVVLITDSEEIWPHRDLCGVDPERSIGELAAAGIEARINIVGLAVRDRAARRQMTRWARIGNGNYFDARNPDELARSVRLATSAPWEAFDEAGRRVASGVVNGDAIELAPGTYRVVVGTDPERVFEAVVVGSGESATLELPPG